MSTVLKPQQPSEEDVRRVWQKIETIGWRAHLMPGAQRTAVGIAGNQGPQRREHNQGVGSE